MNFDFFKLSKYVNSNDFESKSAEAEGVPTAKAYQKFIRAGNVKPGLSQKTIKSRRSRQKNPSIGGSKPLYDTGALANGIMYDKEKKAIVGLARSRDMKYYTKYHLTRNGRVPARDFIEQTNRVLDQEISKEYFGSKAVRTLIKEVRQALKGSVFKKSAFGG